MPVLFSPPSALAMMENYVDLKVQNCGFNSFCMMSDFVWTVQTGSCSTYSDVLPHAVTAGRCHRPKRGQ